MQEEPRQLVLVSQARMALAEARTIDEVKLIRDKAEAMRLYLRQRDESLEAQNTAAEIKLWAERKAGEILAETSNHPAGRPMKNRSHDATYSHPPSEQPKFFHETSPEPAPPTTPLPPKLSDLGISKTESSRWQTIASVPEPEFIEHIEETKAAEQPLTTNGVLKYAKERREEETPETRAAALAERHRKHFLKCLKDIDDLTRAVAAQVQHGGYGGLPAVLGTLSGHERLRVHGTVETMIERLQGWLTHFSEQDDE